MRNFSLSGLITSHSKSACCLCSPFPGVTVRVPCASLKAAWPSPCLRLTHSEGKKANGRAAIKKSLENVEKCLPSIKFQSPAKRLNFKHHLVFKKPQNPWSPVTPTSSKGRPESWQCHWAVPLHLSTQTPPASVLAAEKMMSDMASNVCHLLL